MSYLLDTNVLSELTRPKPNPKVLDWFASVPNDALHVSVITFGELRGGVERLPPSRRRENLRLWLEQSLIDWLGERALPITANVADRWGRLTAAARRPLPTIDALLAATALSHNLRIVTRNTADFVFPGLEVIDPWQFAD